VQQSMHVRSRFEEGQEHTGVQCDMDGIVKSDDEAIEMEIYANLLWIELQRESDQNGFLDGQEHAYEKNSEAEMSPVKKIETGMEQAQNGVIEMIFDASLDQIHYSNVVPVDLEVVFKWRVPH
jgi:hypothetical protein